MYDILQISFAKFELFINESLNAYTDHSTIQESVLCTFWSPEMAKLLIEALLIPQTLLTLVI